MRAASRTHLCRGFRRREFPDLAFETLVILTGLLKIGAKRLNLAVALGRVLLQPADHADQVPLLAFRLLYTLPEGLGLYRGR